MKFKPLALAALIAGMGLYSCGKISSTASDTDQIFVEASDGVVIEQTSLAQEIAQASSKPGFKESDNALNLAEDQQAAIKALHEAYHNNRKTTIAAARETGADRNTLRAQLNALREKFNTDFLAILTAEQQAQYQEMKAQREKRRGRRGTAQGRKGGGKNRVPGPLANLDLTEEQQTAVQALLRTQAEQVKAARKAARANSIDQEAFKKKLAEIKAQFETGLAGILTQEQIAAYEQARQTRAKRLPRPFAGLNLTEEQQTAVRDLLKTYNAKIKPLYQAAKADDADLTAIKAQAATLNAELETGLAGILTQAQIAAYEQAKKTKKTKKTKKGQGRKGGRRGPKGDAPAPPSQSDTN